MEEKIGSLIPILHNDREIVITPWEIPYTSRQFAMSAGSLLHFITNLFLFPADGRPQVLTQHYIH